MDDATLEALAEDVLSGLCAALDDPEDILRVLELASLHMGAAVDLWDVEPEGHC